MTVSIKVFESAGDTSWSAPSLESLFRSHVDTVHRMVKRLLGPLASDADADDLTQLVFIAVNRALPRFRGECKVETWLYGIASRTVLHHLRTNRRYRTMKNAYGAALAQHTNVARDAEAELSDRQELLRIWRALMEIKPKKRVVFVLHELEELSITEIAEQLKTRENTIRSRLHHARIELMANLERQEPRT